MDATTASTSTEETVEQNKNENEANLENIDDVDPNVKFLYRTMQQRDPRKRRVKPVQNSFVQVAFGGLDDSEEDSDFDISKHTGGSGIPDNHEDEDNDNTMESESADDEDDSDVENDDEGEEEEEDSDLEARKENCVTGKDGNERITEDEIHDDIDEEENSLSESESDESDVDDDDDDDIEEEAGQLREDAEAEDYEMHSPTIKPLENIWNSIESDEDDEDYVPKKQRRKAKINQKKAKPITKEKVKKIIPETKLLEKEEKVPPQGRIKVIVCCVCLSDRSADDDEIVECDHCGVSVHEGCYGISESQSIASTESSASTEPWFCDACKACAKPVCELCPNGGGIFKETDAGKWVHLVCALYTPGVAFGDVEKLNLVTLFEMSYSKWGARECSLCEDSRFSHTGVCINCDAGMCKAYFHVTCGQREGLLAEVSPEDVMEVADPFFAYCKLHADKMTSKMKRRNWLAIQSHIKGHKPSNLEDEIEKARFFRKLSRHQEKYSLSKLKRPPAWVPTEKMVRHLHTSPSAVRGFLRKAELMGVITQAQNVSSEQLEARKKAPQGQPSFTPDFITYFLERNVKVDNLKINLSDLNTQNNKLQAQEKVVRRQYDKLYAEVNDLKQLANKIRMDGESLCGMLSDIYGKPVPKIPDVFKGKKRTRTSSRKESASSPTEIINMCGVCSQTTEQHLLAKCDQCKKHYHLGCLDPPLTRMPKKTKLFGWQCSFCVKSSSDDSMKSHPDVDEPRRLRETIKEPDKFFHLSHIQDSFYSQKRKSLQSRKSKKKRQITVKRLGKLGRVSKTKITAGTKSKVSPKQGKKSLVKSKKQSQMLSPKATCSTSQKLDIMCVVCNHDGLLSDTVRCDDCMLSYHLRCLNPPVKKSPKVRGYAWHCEACDMSDSVDVVPGRMPRKHSTSTIRPSGREASNSILFDIDVSSDEI